MGDNFGDVTYEVWRRGGNPDAVDYDRTREDLSYGDSADEIAAREIYRQERAQGARERFEDEEG